MGFFKKIIFSIIGTAGIFWVLDNYIFVESFVVDGGIYGYVVLAIIFGFLNLIVKPIINILTLPIRLITLGLVGFIINGIMLWLLEQSVNFIAVMGAHITIDTWWSYIIVGTTLAFFHALLTWFEK